MNVELEIISLLSRIAELEDAAESPSSEAAGPPSDLPLVVSRPFEMVGPDFDYDPSPELVNNVPQLRTGVVYGFKFWEDPNAGVFDELTGSPPADVTYADGFYRIHLGSGALTAAYLWVEANIEDKEWKLRAETTSWTEDTNWGSADYMNVPLYYIPWDSGNDVVDYENVIRYHAPGDIFLPLATVPAGTAEDDTFRWDVGNGQWEVLPLADTDYKVLQRKSDDSLGYDYLRYH